MRLTKTTGHAIRIAIDCARENGALLKVANIAERLEISQLNVFKIVHILSRAGFVEAVRGRNGGVRLARAADTIRIGDIVRAIEATEIEVVGADRRGRQTKRTGKAHLNVIFDDALEAFISVLDQHTLADMTQTVRVPRATKIARPASKTSALKVRPRGNAAMGRRDD